MRSISEVFRIYLNICAFVFVAVICVEVAHSAENYPSFLETWGLIFTGMVGLVLLGPSAILMVIMDDIRAIRKNL